MNKTQTARLERLMPQGVPRYVRCYDNGGPDAKGGTLDRYTVVFSGKYRHLGVAKGERPQMDFWDICMSGDPTGPQGFCQHGEHSQPVDTIGNKRQYVWPPAIGRRCHLGKRIPFAELPEACRNQAIGDYKSIWELEPKKEGE